MLILFGNIESWLLLSRRDRECVDGGGSGFGPCADAEFPGRDRFLKDYFISLN